MLKFLVLIIKIIVEFIIAGSLLYVSVLCSFPTTMINLILFIPGIFVLVRAHDNLNKIIDGIYDDDF